MHPHPARSLAPLPTFDEFAEAAADPGETRTTPARLQALIRVLAEATRASLSGRVGNQPAEREPAHSPGHATS